jgi:hypothetical protein
MDHERYWWVIPAGLPVLLGGFHLYGFLMQAPWGSLHADAWWASVVGFVAAHPLRLPRASWSPLNSIAVLLAAVALAAHVLLRPRGPPPP